MTDQRAEGMPPKRRKKRSPWRKRNLQNWVWILAFLAGSAFLLPPHRLAGPEWGDDLLSLGGILLVLAGVFIRVCARGWKSQQETRGLVTDGLYGYVRHPLYVGSFLIGMGLCAIIADARIAAIFTLCFWVSHGYVLRSEEKLLAREFPDDYARFAAQSPALVPKLSALVRPKRIIPPDPGDAVIREADAVCLWPLISIGLELWKDYATDPEIFSHHGQRAAVLLGAAVLFGLLWAYLRYRWAQRKANG